MAQETTISYFKSNAKHPNIAKEPLVQVQVKCFSGVTGGAQ